MTALRFRTESNLHLCPHLLHPNAQIFGLTLLFMSLCFDGGTGAYEDKLMCKHHVGPFDLMFNIQFAKMLLAGLGLMISGQITGFFRVSISKGRTKRCPVTVHSERSLEMSRRELEHRPARNPRVLELHFLVLYVGYLKVFSPCMRGCFGTLPTDYCAVLSLIKPKGMIRGDLTRSSSSDMFADGRWYTLPGQFCSSWGYQGPWDKCSFL